MASTTVQEIKDEAHFKQVLTSAASRNKLVVADYYTVPCGPCEDLTPVFERAAVAYADKADFVKVGCTTDPDTEHWTKTKEWPLVRVFRKGKKVGRQYLGFGSEEDFLTYLEGPLGPPSPPVARSVSLTRQRTSAQRSVSVQAAAAGGGGGGGNAADTHDDEENYVDALEGPMEGLHIGNASGKGYDPSRSTIKEDALANFLRASLTGKLTEVPGIGASQAAKLAGGEEPITTTTALIGKFLMLKADGVGHKEHCDLFWNWLKAKEIDSCRSGIVKCIAEKANILLPGIYDEAAFL